MNESPYQSPDQPQRADSDSGQSLSSRRAAYNVVTDTLIGVNARRSDNRFQAIFIGASVVLSSNVGAVLAAFNTQWNLPWYGGAILGSFAGLVIGLIASGAILMVYRAIRHIKGDHQ